MMKVFPASLNKLYDMLHFITEEAKVKGLNDLQSSNIELALEEALVNIISYGYPHRIGTIEIDCSQCDKPGIQIILKDKGIPFNPLTADTSFNQPGTVGGYGVLLIREMMDSVSYRHEQGCNILILTKYC